MESCFRGRSWPSICSCSNSASQTALWERPGYGTECSVSGRAFPVRARRRGREAVRCGISWCAGIVPSGLQGECRHWTEGIDSSVAARAFSPRDGHMAASHLELARLSGSVWLHLRCHCLSTRATVVHSCGNADLHPLPLSRLPLLTIIYSCRHLSLPQPFTYVEPPSVPRVPAPLPRPPLLPPGTKQWDVQRGANVPARRWKQTVPRSRRLVARLLPRPGAVAEAMQTSLLVVAMVPQQTVSHPPRRQAPRGS